MLPGAFTCEKLAKVIEASVEVSVSPEIIAEAMAERVSSRRISHRACRVSRGVCGTHRRRASAPPTTGVAGSKQRPCSRGLRRAPIRPPAPTMAASAPWQRS